MRHSTTPGASLSDNAIVVRGGKCSPTSIGNSLYEIRNGINGIVVFTSEIAKLEEVCELIPHPHIRTTTVGKIRNAGGDVLRCVGRSPFQATLFGIRADYRLPAVFSLPDYSHTSQDLNLESNSLMNVDYPHVFADFNNSDKHGRVRLNTNGAKADFISLGIEPRDGLKLWLTDHEELATSGVVRWDDVEGWVAEIDFSELEKSAREAAL